MEKAPTEQQEQPPHRMDVAGLGDRVVAMLVLLQHQQQL
jgi:hypothetical protein